MQKNIQVRDVIIGSGIPKICVSIIEKTEKEIWKRAEQIAGCGCDLLEWRVDWYQGSEEETMINILRTIRTIVGEMPILVTFRTKKEGGEKDISFEEYKKQMIFFASCGYVDIIDIEAFSFEKDMTELIHYIQKMNCFVIASNHDFLKTPSKKEILEKLIYMQNMGADIVKIAVMPREKKDVFLLLDATQEMKESYAVGPLITMSMKGMGCISRMCGELTGSAVTFASLGSSSAPGQIQIDELKTALGLIHKNLYMEE